MKDIFTFLGYTKIEKMNEDTLNAKDHYLIGNTTFLTGHNDTGDLETFYIHTIWFYTSQLANTTFERHTLGIGIFTMQGFEWRQNKESKDIYRQFTNKKSNLTT